LAFQRGLYPFDLSVPETFKKEESFCEMVLLRTEVVVITDAVVYRGLKFQILKYLTGERFCSGHYQCLKIKGGLIHTLVK
jgi:hypothetical protein